MHLHKIVISLFLTMLVNSAMAENVFYPFKRVLAHPDVQEILDPSVRLFFGTQASSPPIEKSRPDTHSRSGISIAPFGRNPDVLCMEGFERIVESLIKDAKKMGFDAVVNIRGRVGDEGAFSNEGFDCRAGRRTSEVQLISEFALTQDGVRRAEEIERDPVKQAALKRRNPPSKNAIFLPLEDALTLPEAKTILGPTRIHWGPNKAPFYSERYGPNDYDGEASVKELGREAACKKAVLNALASMMEDATEQGYDGIIRIRSYLDEQLAPNDTDFECEAGSRTASVKLQATLAKMR
ncbi:MAG: hypothetical protein JWL63_2065 [Rhodocyclales bacterium]|nr:hypothetical protein [Rhodocyclales bacterium]